MMESSELLRRKIKQNRRKERAERVEQERGGNDGDDDTASPPLKKPRRKPRKSDAEEDIVDGFAIAAFRKYEDLTRAIKAEEEKKIKNGVSVLQGSQQDGVDIKTKPKKPKKPKPENNNTPIITTTPIQPFKVICDRDDVGDSKISDGCSDLFAPLRKDLPGRLSDNLTTPSAHEPTNGLEKFEPKASTGSITALVDDTKISSPKFESSEYSKQYCKNGISEVVGKPEDLNGHIRPPVGIVSNSDSLAVVVDKPRKTVGPTTLFTPYAATAITRVGTPNTSTTNQSITSESLTESPSPTSSLFSSSVNSRPSSSGLSHCTSNSTVSSRFEPNLAITQPRNLSSPVVALEKVLGKPGKPISPPPIGGGVKQPASTPSSTKSSAFGSIAKLLDTPNTHSSSAIGLSSSVNSTSYSQSSQSIYQNGTGVPGSTVNQSNHCSSRSHSPRGHSPSRERDSYSSNVSSLSRTSGTPVSSAAHLPISPLQCLQSYSKAASWLNSTVSGISPLPRRTPPIVGSSSGPTHQLSSSSAVSLPSQGATLVVPAKPPSVPGYPGLVQGTNHSALSLSTSSSAAMFAPPILPLSSIAPHPSPHSSYGMAESLFPGANTTSDLVRRDLESRLQLPSDRSVGSSMGTMYLSRAGDMPHSALLTQLPGHGQMQSPSSSSQNSVPTLFPPPLYKDMPKLGVDSPYFRSGLPMGYPGFNGMLPPSLNNTPFSAPTPSQVAAFTPKAPESSKPARSPKSGKWNAMHVRIAWEIYQDQQKNTDSKSRNVPPLKNSTSTSNSNISSPATSTPAPTSSAASDLLRTPPSLLAGLGRPPDHLGQFPSPYSNPMLGAPGAPPPLRPPLDSSMFLNPLGAHMQRYPGFPSLGPPFGGLGGLSSSMLGRDLASMSPLGAHSDPQWHRNSRPPSYAPPSTPLPPGWPMPRPDMDRKSPMDHRRAKEERHEKRPESRADPGRRSRDLSPFRDRSPVRPPRTPMENGDGDSRSSRSSDSHGAIHLSKSSVRPKEESNGDIERIMTPMTDRDKLLQLQVDQKNAAMLSAAHASRLYHHAGSQMAGPPSSWDTFALAGNASRIPGMDPFRFSMQQFSDRERELHQRLQAAASMRPPFYGNNGPYGPMSLGLAPPGGLGKGGPPAHLSLPLFHSLATHNHLLHASLNGQNSPKLDSINPIMRAKEES